MVTVTHKHKHWAPGSMTLALLDTIVLGGPGPITVDDFHTPLSTINKSFRQKKIQRRKTEVKSSLFAHNMILLYLEDSKDSIKKSVDVVSNFSKVRELKVSMQRSACQ